MDKQIEKKVLENLTKIIELWPSEDAAEKLKELWLDDDDIYEIFDIIGQGIGRASLYKAWAKPKQFMSYLENNTIFKKTIDLVLNWKVTVEIDTTGLHPQLKRAMIQDTEEKIDIDKLLEDFQNPNTEDRNYILYDLIEAKHPSISSIIEKSILDKNTWVQIIAIQGLNKKILNNKIIDNLIELLEKTDNDTIVTNLCRTFEKFNIKKALPSLKKKLQSDNSMILYDCIFCLGEIWTKNEIKYLIPFKNYNNKAEFYDVDWFVNKSTLYTIWEITKDAINKIIFDYIVYAFCILLPIGIIIYYLSW